MTLPLTTVRFETLSQSKGENRCTEGFSTSLEANGFGNPMTEIAL